MPQCRSQQSHEERSPLDELAELIAKIFSGESTPEAAARAKELRLYLRKRLARKGGIAPQDTEDLASDVISAFVTQLRLQPGNPRLVEGKYLWGIAKNKIADYIECRKNQAAAETAEIEGVEHDEVYRGECQRAYEDRQEVVALKARIHRILKRATARDSHLLGGRLVTVLDTVHLVCTDAESVDSVIRVSAAILVEQGVLGAAHTRNLMARFDRQAELRRELGAPQRVVEPTKAVVPLVAKPGTSSSDK